jgi:hypothetical protein
MQTPRQPDEAQSYIAHYRAQGLITALRNVTLCQIAGRLRWEGHEAPLMGRVLREINAACCVPPLPRRDVDRIVRNIVRKPAGNGTQGPGGVPVLLRLASERDA